MAVRSAKCLSDQWPCVSATPVITDQYIDTMIFTLFIYTIFTEYINVSPASPDHLKAQIPTWHTISVAALAF